MRKMWALSAALVVAVTLVVVAGVNAADKEETLKGTLLCAKCTLKEAKECTNALQVKDGDKTVTYLLIDDGNKATYHKGICPPDSKKGATVVGVVSEKDGKKFIKPSKVELDK